MHHVFAKCDFVCGGWEWTVLLALIIRVVISSSLPTVAESVDGGVARAPLESTSVLVVVKCEWGSGLK